MAAEYEVNIKINSQEITRQLEDIDKAVAKIGKSKGGGSGRKTGISGLSPNSQELKAAADFQKVLQGVARAGVEAEKVFGNLRKTAQSAMVAGANEAKQLAAAAAGAPLKSGIGARAAAGMVTPASADAAAKRLEAQIRAKATLEKQLAQDVAAFEARADKRVLEAALNNDKIEFQQKIDDIVKLTNFAIKESKREGKAFDAELKRRGQVQRETQRKRTKRLEGVALGAGFPLLFGGGAGSVIGGGLGGLTGSFGAQIALSAIGQQVDQFVAGVVEAGKALTSVGSAADFMAEKSLFSSDAMQFRIEKLMEEGKVTEAAALMTQEMAKQVGGSGLKALKDLGTEASKMGKLFNTLIVQIQAFVAQGLAPLLAAINKVVGNLVLNNQFNALIEEATGDRAKQIQEFLKPFTREVGGQGARKITQVSEEGKRLAIEKFGGQVIPEGAAIQPTQLEFLRAADRPTPGADKAKREEQRLQQRLAKLEEERQKVMEISRFKDNIAAAEIAGDEQLAIRLRGEQRIVEIEADRKKQLVKVTDQREKDAINIGKAAEKLAAQRQTERELNVLQAARAEANKKVITGLEDQNALLQAKLDGRLEEVQLEQEIKSLLEGNRDLDEERVRSLLEARNALQEQVQVVENLDRIYDQIGQSIASGIVDTLSAAVDQTQSLADAAANTLRNIANILLQLGTNTLLKGTGLSVFENLQGFANGGRPPVNRPSIVGERGPELFIPGAQGTIVPNHAMGSSNIVVNVDASGSQAQGNQSNAKALGAAIGAAVQAELVKQKRPGGLLS